MSASGSISRKRVGSLSQRNGADSPLPLLDIQSIQMPSHPQNALALKTAALTSTKSLFQTCSQLRRRLRCVEDFAPFLEQPPDAEPLDVVAHMCHVFRLGSPLLHLYNLLLPIFNTPSSELYSPVHPIPQRIDYDMPSFISYPDGVRNWAKRPENAKNCQRYIAKFGMAAKQRYDEGRWPAPTWALHELWGQTSGDEIESYDSTGLMKVLRTVEMILDHLPDSAMTPLSPQTPHTAAGQAPWRGHASMASCDVPFSMGGSGSGSGSSAMMPGGSHQDAVIQSPVSIDGMTHGLRSLSIDSNAFKSVEELVSSEKSYVNELEVLVQCSNQMVDAHLISAETRLNIFSNLSKILDHHRKFLIKLETEYECIQEGRSWSEGRWGRPFINSEADFECYGPFCANYTEAMDLLNEIMPTLLRGQTLPESQRPCLHPERELQAFMIKPIQRITKYSLLLDAILHATAKHDYAYRSELAEARATVKRITSKTNDLAAMKEKQAKVRDLIERVEDWKGHDVTAFGDLWLDDHFIVSKDNSPREYHVFLFTKMMLCCKEAAPNPREKKQKNSTMLRKDKAQSRNGMPEKRKLALKGRIFVSNIASATLSPPENQDTTPAPRLTITWTVPETQRDGNVIEVPDYFLMIGKSEDQMKKWQAKVEELMIVEKERKAEKNRQLAMRQRAVRASQERYQSSQFPPPTPASERPAYGFPPPTPSDQSHGGWREDDEINGPMSGRSTPSYGHGSHASFTSVSGRRVQSQQSMPAASQAELRAPRAMTEDHSGPSMSQWRTHGNPLMPPPLPRLQSNMSAMSAVSEASFGSVPSSSRGMRHQSSSRLGVTEGIDEEGDAMATDATPQQPYRPTPRGMIRAPSQGVAPTMGFPVPPALRNRSASSPHVYQIQNTSRYPSASAGAQQPTAPPPAPGHGGHGWTHPSGDYSSAYTGSASTLVGGTAYFTKRMSAGKRSSGDSHSTETSETSSQQSPATPYTSAPALVDFRGTTPVSRQNSSDTVPSAGLTGLVSASGPGGKDKDRDNVVVKIKCADGTILTIQVPPNVDFFNLKQRVLKKVRMTRKHDQADIQLRWLDSDEDEIALKTNDDVEAMLEEHRDAGGGGMITLVAR